MTKYLSEKNYKITGVDIGWFKNDLVEKENPKFFKQHYKSFSKITTKEISKVDYIVHLAGVSNDPIGKEFKKITRKINVKETKELIDKVSKFKEKLLFLHLHAVFMVSLRIILRQRTVKQPP